MANHYFEWEDSLSIVHFPLPCLSENPADFGQSALIAVRASHGPASAKAMLGNSEAQKPSPKVSSAQRSTCIAARLIQMEPRIHRSGLKIMWCDIEVLSWCSRCIPAWLMLSYIYIYTYDCTYCKYVAIFFCMCTNTPYPILNRCDSFCTASKVHGRALNVETALGSV